MVVAKTTPIIQANFFGCAPTYSGTWFLTIKRPIINEGENLGLTKTRIIKSVRNMVIPYFISKKFPLNRISINEINNTKNSIPADALISLSFKTGTLRFFEAKYASPVNLTEVMKSRGPEADGQIIYILFTSEIEKEQILNKAQALTNDWQSILVLLKFCLLYTSDAADE